MIGKTISHYRIVEELGRGGMGVVYKAEDTKLNRTVALKFLPPEFTRDEEAGKRFIREAQAAAALNHVNICTIHEIDEHEDRSFIAMEYIEGKSLREMIASGPLALKQAIDIAMQTAAGLAEAHEKHVVHRDIKPANIMITARGKVKITDFGMAQLRGGTLLTKEGTTLGTVAYMPPEQAHGGEVDNRADIWSLGVMLYEMVSGRRPFKGDYDQAMIYSILNDDSDPLTGLRTGVPPELERIVEKCLAKEKDERYQTAADLMADLRHLVRTMGEGKAASAAADQAASVPPDRRKLRWLPIAAPAALIVILAAVYLSGVFRPGRERGAGTLPAEEKIMIAVLPFENLGPPDDGYFADGITDAITARLAGLSGLGVISRQSAVQYKGTSKSIGQISEELGVGYVLEGTIQRERPGDPHSRVRIIPQLIRCADDIHLWAGTFDGEMTEVFRLQSEIAGRVAGELDVKLLGRERAALSSRPTENMDAYDYYLRALEYGDARLSSDASRKMIDLLGKAVETDPRFALAWTMISQAHIWRYWTREDRGGLSKAESAVEEAIRIDPALPEIETALGYIQYYGHQDFEKAGGHFDAALEKMPNNVEATRALGLIRRRQGRWDESLSLFERAARINPRDFSVYYEGIVFVLIYMHRFEEAKRHLERVISLSADLMIPYFEMAHIALNRDGDVEEARRNLDRMMFLAGAEDLCLLLQHIETSPLARICYGSSCGLVEKLESADCGERGEADEMRLSLLKFICPGEESSPQEALEYADSVSAVLAGGLPGERQLIASRLHIILGKLYALLGRGEDAVREGRLAAEMMPVSRDAIEGPDILYEVADIYMMVGNHETALDVLEELLPLPSNYTMTFIGLDPLYEPLRGHPRYLKLVEKYSVHGS